MTIYGESSAIASIYLREPGRHTVLQGELESDGIVSSLLTYVEVRATLARAAFREDPPRLTRSGYDRVVKDFESDWPNHGRVPVTEELLMLAGELARTHLLRAYDAVHLATALRLSRQLPDQLLISTWDTDLASAALALAEGLSLAHEVNT